MNLRSRSSGIVHATVIIGGEPYYLCNSNMDMGLHATGTEAVVDCLRCIQIMKAEKPPSLRIHDGACRSCRWLSGVKRGAVEKRLCVRGHVFAAVAGGVILPELSNLRRADLPVKERCLEWERR